MYDHLAAVGYTLKPKGAKGAVCEFTPEQIELMAELEHEEWMKERIANGWTLGERDFAKKTTPYLIPYGDLSEEIKDYDRDAVRNIFALADRIGMAVYEC